MSISNPFANPNVNQLKDKSPIFFPQNQQTDNKNLFSQNLFGLNTNPNNNDKKDKNIDTRKNPFFSNSNNTFSNTFK